MLWKRIRVGPKARRYLTLIGAPLSLILAILILWEAIVRIFDISAWLLPPPSLIGRTIIANWGLLLRNSWVTLRETLGGFILAVGGGVALAIAICWSDYLRNALYPILLFFQSVPKVALAPIIIIWFGYGFMPKLLISFLIAFFPIVVSTAAGMVAVDPDLMNLAQSLAATRSQIFVKIRLPNSLPFFFSAMKISITLALVGAIIAEFVAAEAGLGFLILHAGAYLNTALQFACFIMLAIIGIALFGTISIIQKVTMPWFVPTEEVRPRAAAA